MTSKPFRDCLLSITDDPDGHAMLAPDRLSTDRLARGREAIIHLAGEDWNRNALERRGRKPASEGFGTVLCLSGDYPLEGYVYNARKDDEVLRYVAHENLSVKALDNVFLLSRPAARTFNVGRIPA